MTTFDTSTTSSSSVPSSSVQVDQDQSNLQAYLHHCRFDNQSHIRIQNPTDREHCKTLSSECETFKNVLDDFDSLYRRIQHHMEEISDVMRQERLIALGIHNIVKIEQHQKDEKKHE